MVKGGENARGMKEEDEEEAEGEITEDYCLWCKEILNWSEPT